MEILDKDNTDGGGYKKPQTPLQRFTNWGKKTWKSTKERERIFRNRKQIAILDTFRRWLWFWPQWWPNCDRSQFCTLVMYFCWCCRICIFRKGSITSITELDTGVLRYRIMGKQLWTNVFQWFSLEVSQDNIVFLWWLLATVRPMGPARISLLDSKRTYSLTFLSI